MSTHLTDNTAGTTIPADAEESPTTGTTGEVGAVSAGGQTVEESFPWQALQTLSTRQLRLMCNRVFKALDADFPPAETADQYAALVEEISGREAQAKDRSTDQVRSRREENLAFRDSLVGRRFELHVDGALAGYVKYQMHGGQVILLETVTTPDFSFPDSGIEETLIRRTFLDAHRRRLAIRVHCDRVRSFLTEHPQYRFLVPASGGHATARTTSQAF